MKYKIAKVEIENNLETTGEDVSFFHIFIEIEDFGLVNIPIFLHFDQLIRDIGATDPAIKKYMDKIRAHISGYGPKDSKMLDVLAEEGFDFTPYMQAYVTDDLVEDIFERSTRPNTYTPEQIKERQKMFEELDNLFDPEYNKKYNAFIEAVDAALHAVTLQYFPELFEKGEAVIDQYKDVLIRATMDFSEEIDKLNFHN